MSFPKVLQGRKDNYDMHGRNRLGYDSGFREGWKQVPFLKMNRFTYCKAWFWQPPNHKHVSRSPRQQSPDTMIDWKLKSIGSCGAIFKRNQGGHNPWMSWTQHLWHLLKTKNKKNTLWKQVPLEQKTSNYINSWKCPKNVPFFRHNNQIRYKDLPTCHFARVLGQLGRMCFQSLGTPAVKGRERDLTRQRVEGLTNMVNSFEPWLKQIETNTTLLSYNESYEWYVFSSFSTLLMYLAQLAWLSFFEKKKRWKISNISSLLWLCRAVRSSAWKIQLHRGKAVEKGRTRGCGITCHVEPVFDVFDKIYIYIYI